MNDDLAAKIAALEAELAALRAAQAAPSAEQSISTGDGGTVSDNVLVSAGNDALVLRDITIAAGGRLELGGRPLDLPPDPAAVEQALAAYLRTLLERYHYLNLQGMGAGGTQQARIMLRAVFIDLRTDYAIAEARALLGESQGGRMRGRRLPPPSAASLSDDLRRWIDELFTPEEQTQLFAPLVADDARGQQEVFAELLGRSEEQVQRLEAPRTALELIRHERALVLLGDPGSGKTTVLRHLALGFAYARLYAEVDSEPLGPELAWAGPLPLPVLVQLRRLAEELAGPPHDAGPLLEHLQRVLTGDRLEPLAHHLVARLEAGEVLVLLDGLDEIADDAQRAWAARAAGLFQSRFPRSRVVLTSRIYAYREPCLLPPPFRVATLQPLTDEAQDDFLARWYRAALLQGSELAGAEQAQAAAERSRELIAALERRPRLREIAGNPLLLTMIALVHQQRYRLPQQRAELYRECLLVLLEQWEQRRAEGGRAGLAVELGVRDDLDRLALIQPIAYELQVCGREEATQREARRWLLERFLDLADGDRDRARGLIDRFLAFLEGRSGLLIARDIGDRYAFPHKTFQEYLAARELTAGERLVAEVLAHRHAPTWREVILLAAGHLVAGGFARQARELAWALLDADPEGSDDFFRSAVLAGEIVEELGSVLGREGQALKEQVVGALVALVQGGRLSAKERVEAAFLLGRLGDPRLPRPEQPGYWCAVAPGTFWYGDDRQGELKQLSLDYGFKIGRYAVTNAEFAAFMAAGGYEREAWWTPEGWKWRLPGGHAVSWEDNERSINRPWLWDRTTYTEPSQPVVGVSWYEAVAYCRWLTAAGHAAGWLPHDEAIRLPTSLEWERAARGDDPRRYPWVSDEPTPEHANYQETSIGRPAPVGCFPRGSSPCGAQDMVGNTQEWMATAANVPGAVEPRIDFAIDSEVLMGYDDYRDRKEQICCGSRGWGYPFNWYNQQSFRVLRSLRTY